MAYSGTTTTSPNLPRLVSQPMAGRKIFEYVTTDTQAAVGTSDYFSEPSAARLGISVGDQVLVMGSTTYIVSSHAANAGGGTSTYVSLSAGLLISSAS